MSALELRMNSFIRSVIRLLAGYMAGLFVASIGSMLALLIIVGEGDDGAFTEWAAYAAAWTILVALFTAPFVLVSLLIAKLLSIRSPWFYVFSAGLAGLAAFAITLGSGDGQDERYMLACGAVGLVGCLSGSVFWAIAVKP